MGVTLGADGQLHAREASQNFVGPLGKPLITDDLARGPGWAAAAVEARYPNAEIGGLALVRRDCRLVWSVGQFDGRSDPA
jgi:hypothetical protein